MWADNNGGLAGDTLSCLASHDYQSPAEENDRCFADDIFKGIFWNENFRILIRISLKFVPYGPIDNKWALVQVRAWRRTGAKPLSEPMLTHFIDAYMRH